MQLADPQSKLKFEPLEIYCEAHSYLSQVLGLERERGR